MVRLTALLPLRQGISVFASLKKHADAIRGIDERSHAQIMADTGSPIGPISPAPKNPANG